MEKNATKKTRIKSAAPPGPTPIDDLAVQIAGKLLDAIEQKKKAGNDDLKRAA